MSPRLVPLGLATLMLGLLLASNRSEPTAAYEPVKAANPQAAALGWVERFPAEGRALVYRVKALRVESDGWQAEIAIENQTDRRYEIPVATDPAGRVFGVMMFTRGDLEDLTDRGRTADYPIVRSARTIVPVLPRLLAPGDAWSGTIAAPGSLPAGKWLRVVFGPLTVVGEVPDDVPPEVIWITDHAYRLRSVP